MRRTRYWNRLRADKKYLPRGKVNLTHYGIPFVIKLTANEMLTSWLMSVCSIPLVSRNRSHFVTLFLPLVNVPGNPNDNETFIGQLYRMGQVPSKGKDY